MSVSVIGAGLAGCEAAVAIANNGIKVRLYEMKPKEMSPAHKSRGFAELVCSNSLKASRIDSSAGLLKWEMKTLGSICVSVAEKCAVPAGGALAVDRNIFSQMITDIVKSNSNIEVIEQRVSEIPEDDYVIIASGPLTDGKLAEKIENLCGTQYLSFYDAAAPIVTADSIDLSKAFFASRYDKGNSDYINCPFSKAEYEGFHEKLVNAESAELHKFDKGFSVYEGCMPIEVLAKRGLDAIRFGPMKPVGLCDPNTGHRPWAAVQLRKENLLATMFNLVGFQTNLKFSEQKRVFSLIPGLENAEFLRYGVMHRNSFVNSPKLLNSDFSMRTNPNIYFAGQISGVEGYMESASSGLISALSVVSKIKGQAVLKLPKFSMIGALCGYISDSTVEKFQPMGANFGVLPPLEQSIRDKRERYMELSQRSVNWFDNLGKDE